MPDPILTSFDKAKRLKRKSLEEQGIITKVPTDIIFADEVVDDNNTEENVTDVKIEKNEVMSPKDSRRLFILKKSDSKLSDDKAIDYIEYMKKNRLKKYEKLGNLSDENIIKSADDIFNKLDKYDHNITFNLVNIKPEGQGKGEYFLEFIYDDAESLGDKQSFDIKCNNGKKFEVKCYENDHTAIRLGTEGTASRSKGYVDFITLLMSINKITTMNDADISVLMSMVSNILSKLKIDSEDKFKKIINNLIINKNNENIYYKFMSGAFNPGDMLRLGDNIDLTKSIVDEIYNNNFEFAKLIKEDKMYVTKLDENGKPMINHDGDTVYIECITTDVNNEEKIKKYIIDIRDSISNCYKNYNIDYDSEKSGKEYIDKFFNIAEEEINKNFEKHSMILVNKNIKNPIVHGIYRKFLVYNISQSGFSIIPDTPKNRERIADSRDKK